MTRPAHLAVFALLLAPAITLSLSSCSVISESTTNLTSTPQPTSSTTRQEPGFEKGTDEWVAWEALMGPDGEYAAAASYQAVLDLYGEIEPYSSIYQAELRHIEALKRQLGGMGIDVPENPYTGTIEAPNDLTTAAKNWAEGEKLNIAMYDELLTYTDNAQLVRVLNNLRWASLENHLPAFEAAAANGGKLP